MKETWLCYHLGSLFNPPNGAIVARKAFSPTFPEHAEVIRVRQTMSQVLEAYPDLQSSTWLEWLSLLQ